MRYKKKLIKVGNSVGITLPADWVKSYTHAYGDKWVVIYWNEKDDLVITPCADAGILPAGQAVDPAGVLACDED